MAFSMIGAAAAVGSMVFEAIGHKQEWPVSFRRTVAVSLLVVVGLIVVASFVQIGGGFRWVTPSRALLGIGILLVPVALYLLIRIPRRIRDHTVAQMIHSAKVIAEHVGVDPVRSDGVLKAGRKAKKLSVPGLFRRMVRSSDWSVVLLRGQMGAGKTVSLRLMAQRHLPSDRRAVKGVRIPVYVDLGSFSADGIYVDADLYRRYVARLLGNGDPDLADRVLEYLRDKRDIVEWVFLFDSFDELADFASATDVKRTAEAHLTAIRHLVEGLPNSRAIVAGREFPESDVSLALPVMTMLPLSPKSRRALIRSSRLDTPIGRQLYRRTSKDPAVRAMADNPLTLSLLCELVADTGTAGLPTTMPEVLDRAIHTRLTRILGRSAGQIASAGLREERVYEIAQELAFCIAVADRPDRSAWTDIERTRAERGFEQEASLYGAALVLDAAELAGFRTLHHAGQVAPTSVFSFSHRLIQDYLAATLIAKRLDLVDPGQLLTAPRWEQVTPLLLQVGGEVTGTTVWPMAEELLRRALNDVTGLVDAGDDFHLAELRRVERFEWPTDSIAVIRVLTAGVTADSPRPPLPIRDMVGRLVLSAFISGTSFDRSFALDALPLVSPEIGAWAIGRTVIGENVPALRVKALDLAVSLNLMPVENADLVRFRLVESALDNKRSWHVDTRNAADSLSTGFVALPAVSLAACTAVAMAAILAAVFGGKVSGWWGPLIVLAVAILVWHLACRGLSVPRTLANLCAGLFTVAAFAAVVLAWASTMSTVAHSVRGRGDATLRDLQSLLIAMVVIWSFLAVVAVICDADARNAMLRPYAFVARFVRLMLARWPQPVGALWVAAPVTLSCFILAIVSSPQQLSSGPVQILRSTLTAFFGLAAALSLAWAVFGGHLHDLRLLRRSTIARTNAVSDDDLLYWLTNLRTRWGIGRLLHGLDVRSRDDAKLLAGAQLGLVNLDHALDHVHRAYASNSGTWGVPNTFWEFATPFTQPSFVRWLRTPATGQHKLRWLVQEHRGRIVLLRERAAGLSARSQRD